MTSLSGFVIILAAVTLSLEDVVSNDTVYSRPPTNLPVKKVVIHGRTIYVRPSYQQPISQDSYRGKNKARERRHRYSSVQPSNPNPAIPLREQYIRSSQYVKPPQPQYVQPPPSYRPAPIESYVPEPPKPKYPLPECYTNDSGFMCCNKELEHVIGKTYDELKKSQDGKWKNCNVQQLASKLSENAEKAFNTTFESIAGIDDYASKSHFFSNFICKVEREGRYMLAYGSPKRPEPEPEVYGPPPEAPPYNTWRY
ncbi:hypothetical protein QR680_001237 [Steinernema hermaphroditum]|uniref:Ground-like domain-containing protein n=1 Tax=Steinernema hermaphroditum TaxID=289476 RepID=A0AA39H076_9BILA|nr:hypothetical protein QR680_001237 [Steinernema hermaphroditum]